MGCATRGRSFLSTTTCQKVLDTVLEPPFTIDVTIAKCKAPQPIGS